MSILSSTRYWAKQKQEWADQVKRAYELVMDLPAEVQELNGSADLSGEKLELEIWQSKEVDVIEILKRHGATFSTPEISVYSGDYYTKGEMPLGNIEVAIKLYGLEAPEGCRVEQYEETVKRYRSICEDEEAKADVEVS